MSPSLEPFTGTLPGDLMSLIEKLFDDRYAAERWARDPHGLLGQISPAEAWGPAKQSVEDLVTQMIHGVSL
jgi:hypothetical protein